MNSLTLGPVVIGENRTPIDLDQVEIKTNVPGLSVDAGFIPDSLQWVRVDNVLALPRARLSIKLKADAKDITLRYMDTTLVTQADGDSAVAELFVVLFYPSVVDVYFHGVKRGTIGFSMTRHKEGRTHLYDYSCIPFDLMIKGMHDEFMSVGCYLARHGAIGAEKGTLEVRWAAADWSLVGDSQPPYVATMQPGKPARFSVRNREGNERTVEFLAQIPERIPRLKTALGLGPYFLRSRDGTDVTPTLPSAAVMLYGRLDLTDTSSLRFFEAYFHQKTLFNNYGFYYAYDVGAAFDRRVELALQLGFQGIQYRHRPGATLDNMNIFPQGFEITYRHAFGWRNHSLVYGMFLPTSVSEDYKNVWIRFGKRVFWELNYLSWTRQDRSVQAYGLSTGIPFMNFL